MTFVRALIDIGRSLNHRVIAKGVDTRAQVDFLQSPGRKGPGYFFSHPLVADQFGRLLRTGALTGMIQ